MPILAFTGLAFLVLACIGYVFDLLKFTIYTYGAYLCLNLLMVAWNRPGPFNVSLNTHRNLLSMIDPIKWDDLSHSATKVYACLAWQTNLVKVWRNVRAAPDYKLLNVMSAEQAKKTVLA